jgi:hypothetical protein
MSAGPSSWFELTAQGCHTPTPSTRRRRKEKQTMPHSTSSSIVIRAPRAKVWEALTQPEIVRTYFFGTNLVTDWKVGSPLFFRGEWDGARGNEGDRGGSREQSLSALISERRDCPRG